MAFSSRAFALFINVVALEQRLGEDAFSVLVVAVTVSASSFFVAVFVSHASFFTFPSHIATRTEATAASLTSQVIEQLLHRQQPSPFRLLAVSTLTYCMPSRHVPPTKEAEKMADNIELSARASDHPAINRTTSKDASNNTPREIAREDSTRLWAEANLHLSEPPPATRHHIRREQKLKRMREGLGSPATRYEEKKLSAREILCPACCVVQ